MCTLRSYQGQRDSWGTVEHVTLLEFVVSVFDI